jgi:hypothetical protein
MLNRLLAKLVELTNQSETLTNQNVRRHAVASLEPVSRWQFIVMENTLAWAEHCSLLASANPSVRYQFLETACEVCAKTFDDSVNFNLPVRIELVNRLVDILIRLGRMNGNLLYY